MPGIRGGDRAFDAGSKPFDGGAAASPLRQARVFKASAAAWAARSGKPGRRATGSRRRYVPGSRYDPVCYLFDDAPPPPPEMRMVHAGRFPANLREESHEEYPGQWVPIEEATEELGTVLEELVNILRERKFAGVARYGGQVCIERQELGRIESIIRPSGR